VEKLRTHTIPIYVYIYICKYVGTGGWLSWKKDVCVVKDRGLHKAEDKAPNIHHTSIYISNIHTIPIYMSYIYVYVCKYIGIGG